MPSLEAVDQFKATVQSLGNEPAIRAKLGLPMDEITPPEAEISDDLASLLGEQPGMETPPGDLDALLADNMLDQDGGEAGPALDLDGLPADHDVLGDLLDHPNTDPGVPDLDALLGGPSGDLGLDEALPTPDFDEPAAPSDSDFPPGFLDEVAGPTEPSLEEDPLAGLGLDLPTEPESAKALDATDNFNDELAGLTDGLAESMAEDTAGLDELGSDFPGDDLIADFNPEEVAGPRASSTGVSPDEMSDDFFNTPGELLYDDSAGGEAEALSFDDAEDDLSFDDEGLPPSSLDEDDYAFDEDGSLDRDNPDLRGLSVSEKEVEDFDETGEADEFQLGDFSSQFGITDEEHLEAESLNPAEVLQPGEGDEEQDLNLTDEEFQAIQRTLSLLPLNLKLSIEEAIGEKETAFDDINRLVKLLIAGASPRNLANTTGKILGKTIKIPAGFEKGTGAEMEAQRASLWYNIRTVMLPVVRVFLLGSAAAALLIWLGWSFIYHPISAGGLYKQGYDKILAGEPQAAEDLFATAYKRWPDETWFFKYADAFQDMGEYEYARKKYRQLLKPVIDLTPSSPTNGQEIYQNYNKHALLDWARLERDFGYDGKDRNAHFNEAHRLLRKILDRSAGDKDGLLADGDNYQTWAKDTADSSRLEDAKVTYSDYLKRYGYDAAILYRFIDYFMLVDSNAPSTPVTKEVLRLKEIVLNSKKLEVNPEVVARLAGWLLDKDALQRSEGLTQTVAVKTIEEEYGIRPKAKRSQDEKPIEYKPKQTSGLVPGNAEGGGPTSGKSHSLEELARAEASGHGGGGSEAPAGPVYLPSLQPKYPLTDEPYKFNYVQDVRALLDLGLSAEFKLPDLHYQLARYFRLMGDSIEEKKALGAADIDFQNLPTRQQRVADRLEQRILTLNRIGELLRDDDQPLSAEKYFQEAQKRYEMALDQRLVAPQGAFGRIYANLSDIYYRESGSWKEALKLLVKAEGTGLKSPEINFKKGVILYQLGQFNQAAEEFYLTENYPGRPDLKKNRNVLYAMATALYRTGNYYAAQGYYWELLGLAQREREKIADLDIANNRLHRIIMENLLKVYNNLAAALYAGQGRSRQDSQEAGAATLLVTKADEIFRNLTRTPATYEGTKNRSLASVNLKAFFSDQDRKTITIYPHLPESLETLAF